MLPGKIMSALQYMYPNGYEDQTRRVALGAELREVVVKKFAWDGLCKKILTPLASRMAPSRPSISGGGVRELTRTPSGRLSKVLGNRFQGVLTKKGKYLNSWKRYVRHSLRLLCFASFAHVFSLSNLLYSLAAHSRWFVLNRRPDGINTLSFYLSEENMVEKATYALKDAVIEVWPHENMMKEFGFVLRLADKKAQGEFFW
jgi:hypothetical protein